MVSHRVERKVEMAGVIAQIVHYPVNSDIGKLIMGAQSYYYFFKGK